MHLQEAAISNESLEILISVAIWLPDVIVRSGLAQCLQNLPGTQTNDVLHAQSERSTCSEGLSMPQSRTVPACKPLDMVEPLALAILQCT